LGLASNAALVEAFVRRWGLPVHVEASGVIRSEDVQKEAERFRMVCRELGLVATRPSVVEVLSSIEGLRGTTADPELLLRQFYPKDRYKDFAEVAVEQFVAGLAGEMKTTLTARRNAPVSMAYEIRSVRAALAASLMLPRGGLEYCEGCGSRLAKPNPRQRFCGDCITARRRDGERVSRERARDREQKT
jgi:hypothetical protein